jgi:hypothetical protein
MVSNKYENKNHFKYFVVFRRRLLPERLATNNIADPEATKSWLARNKTVKLAASERMYANKVQLIFGPHCLFVFVWPDNVRSKNKSDAAIWRFDPR